MKCFTYFLLLVFMIAGIQVKAQYFEAGVMLGATNYQGDLQHLPVTSEYHLGFGVLTRWNINKYFAVKATFLKGEISGNDDNKNNNNTIRARNLDFKSVLYEVGITGEFNFTPYEIRSGKMSAPYLFAGVAGFYFNPQASYNGEMVDLQPLGTEGQTLPDGKSKYSLYQFAVPLGLGCKLNLSPRVNVGFEFGYRLTFTDYLDDISEHYPDIDKLKIQNPLAATLSYRSPEYYGHELSNPVGRRRGDTSNRDWYFFGGLNVTINIAYGYGLELDKKYNDFKDKD